MSATVSVLSVGPGVSVQDTGRPGYLSEGLSRGGAVDRLALAEGAALLGDPGTGAALEMAGMGGSFSVDQPTRIALTGAPMRVDIDGDPVAWNAVHLLEPGSRLTIGGALAGVYGYLHFGGGIDTAMQLGGRATNEAAGLGHSIRAGDTLPLGPDAKPERTGLKLSPETRFGGGDIRFVPSLHSNMFDAAEIARLQNTEFKRDARGNRMGVRMASDGPGFGTTAGLSILSEVIAPGDIQIVGDGAPFVLLADCQTTGGYPRIGSVLPCDIARVAQAQPGTPLRFCMVSLDEGVDIERKAAQDAAGLSRRVEPLVRRSEDIRNLLSYQLISGVTSGADLS